MRELQRLLGKKTLENEILYEALDLAQRKRLLRSPRPIKTAYPENGGGRAGRDTIEPGGARGVGANLATRVAGRSRMRPTYGYRRVHTLLCP
jgi:hypothetical protein